MTIYLGADHRGFVLKEQIKKILAGKNYTVEDLGAQAMLPHDDYVDYAQKVAQKVSENDHDKGIVICGSGVGVDIVANKTQGIRCVLGFAKEQVVAARADDDCNMLALPADYVSSDQAHDIVGAFLQTGFKTDEKYQRRIDKIKQIEQTQ